MDPVMFRLGMVALVSLAPLIARVAYLWMNPPKHGGFSGRHVLISCVMALVGLMFSWNVNRIGWQNFDFAGFLMIFGIISLVFHAGALPFRKNGYTEYAEQKRQFRLSMLVILPMFACIMVPVLLANDIDERIINETLAATSAPDVTFVPSTVEIAWENGREVFQLRTRRTSVRGGEGKLFIVSLPRSPENDTVLLPLRARLNRGTQTTYILRVHPNSMESGDVVTLAANEVVRLRNF